jgi:hypothetical protein
MSQPPDDIKPAVACQMLYDFFYRVARWPDDINISVIHAGFRALKKAVEQNEILQRDLADACRDLEIEQRTHRADISKIDALQKKLKEARP